MIRASRWLYCFLLILWSEHLFANGLRPLRLQLQFYHQFQFAGFYAALQQGYYRDAGLDITIIEGVPGIKVVQRVLDGDAEFAVSDTEVLIERLKGQAVVALGVIFQHSAYCFVTLSSSGILTLQDLRGKRVGIPEGRGEALFRALLQSQQIPLDSFEQIIPQWDVQSLIDRELDVTASYATGGLYSLREKGLSFHVLHPQAYGVDFYGDTLFTSEHFLALEPEISEKFRKASFKGWRYAFDHPEAIIDYILSIQTRNPQPPSREKLRFEATMMRQLILPDLIEPGSMRLERWQKMAEMIPLSLTEQDIQKSLKKFFYQAPEVQRQYRSRMVLVSLGVVTGGLLMAVVWNLQLRKAVHRQTTAIAESMRVAQLHSEEARQANAAKSIFLAGVSHEFRTPLTAILGFTDLLQKAELSAPHSKWVGLIQARAKDLLRMVNQLLDLVYEPKVDVVTEAEDFTLASEIEGVILSLDPLLQQKSLSIDVGVKLHQVQLRLSGSPACLRQVLFNLLHNAIKFSPEQGRICIDGEIEESYATSVRLHFTVADHGPGIPDEMKKMIFEAFFQAHTPVATDHMGAGLGLAICESLVRSMDGSIWVEDLPTGQGACFHFTARFALSGARESEGLVHSLKILVVDDDAVTRELIRAYFAMHDVMLQEASSASEAREACRRQRFDCVFMDLNLPDYDGTQATQWIRSDTDSLNRDTPIIALTASLPQKERSRCLEAGMVAFLSKPIHFHELIRTVQEHRPGR